MALDNLRIVCRRLPRGPHSEGGAQDGPPKSLGGLRAKETSSVRSSVHGSPGMRALQGIGDGEGRESAVSVPKGVKKGADMARLQEGPGGVVDQDGLNSGRGPRDGLQTFADRVHPLAPSCDDEDALEPGAKRFGCSELIRRRHKNQGPCAMSQERFQGPQRQGLPT